jgi:uncharacterized protein
MRVFLDANVLFSAAYLSDGRTKAIFDLAAAGHCELVSSSFAVEEARRNIAAKRPGNQAEFNRLLHAVDVSAEPSAQEVEWALAQGIVRKDAPILAAAVRARAQLLVTGDKTHFGTLFGKTLAGVRIEPPASALARILKVID